MSARGLRGLELVMAHLEVTDLIVGEIDRPIPEAVLRKAAFRLQRRHPSLRACLTFPESARPRVMYCYPDPDRVEVEVMDGTGDAPDARPRWQRVAEAEANRRFDGARGYMFRVVWVPGSVGGHVILSAQHALVDGLSLMRLLYELLVASAELMADPAQEHLQGAALDALSPTPAALDYFGTSLLSRLIRPLARRALVRSQRDYQHSSPFAIQASLPASDTLRTEGYFAVGTRENYERTRASCKQHGVTVGAAFSASVEFASLRVIAREGGSRLLSKGSVRFPMTMDFSLRRSIPGGSRSQDAVGLLIGASDISVGVPWEIGFWELARRLNERSRQQYDSGAPLNFVRILDGFWDLPHMLTAAGIDYVASGGVAESVNISNVGQYPYPAKTGEISLLHVFGLNTLMKGGPMFIQWLRSVDGHFCYTGASAAPASNRARGEALFSSIIDLLENCHHDAMKRTTLGDWVNQRIAPALRR